MKTDQHGPGGFDLSNHVILIIDDDPNSLAIVSEYLEECRCTVLIAEDGESGLARAEYARPDLILLDIMMPVMDGFETCRRLKAMADIRDIPVIFMTALAETEHKVRGFAAGAVDYITKPFQPEEVLARIQIHLQLRELTERLEQKVVERTEELTNANQQLQQEVSERRRAEERLQESEERLRLTLEATQIGIWDWDVTNDRWYASPTYYVMLGYDPRTGLGDRDEWLERVHPDDRAFVQEKIQGVLAQEFRDHQYEARLRHADGTYRWMLVRGISVAYDQEGNVSRMLGVRMDITERKQAEAELRQLKDDLEQRVKERTADLEAKNEELERANRLFVGRELKMIELKKVIRKLEAEATRDSD